MLVMEFGRFVQRPCPPQPPRTGEEWSELLNGRMEPWEVGYGLRVEIDPFLAGPYERPSCSQLLFVEAPRDDVLAWALILKEEIPDAAIGSEALGVAQIKAESKVEAKRRRAGEPTMRSLARHGNPTSPWLTADSGIKKEQNQKREVHEMDRDSR